MQEEKVPFSEAGEFKGINVANLSEEDKMMIKNRSADQSEGYKNCLSCCGGCPKFCCVVCAPCGYGPIKIVDEGFCGLIKTLGRYTRKVGPGVHALNPCTESMIMVDMRSTMQNIQPQSLLTKDNVTLQVDAFCQYRITIPELAVFKCANVPQMIIFTTQGVMKTIFCEHPLSELLTNRKVIEQKITE